MDKIPAGALSRLARLYGVQTVYHDGEGRRCPADAETLLAVLTALGAPVQRLADVPQALYERLAAPAAGPGEPVVVAWDGRPAHLDLQLAPGADQGRIDCCLQCEDGRRHTWQEAIAALPLVGAVRVGAQVHVRRRLVVSPAGGLPPGYHRLQCELPGRSWQTLIIAAPTRAYAPPGAGARSWGLFLPLYALRTERSLATGDLSDLGALQGWVAAHGGSYVGTLPLLAAFLGDEPFDPSPYAPVSRLFWNEFYLDLRRLPEWPAAAAEPALAAAMAQLAALGAAPLVAYRQAAAIRRRVLQELAARCCAAGAPPGLQRFLAEQPEADAYAIFRAVTERQGRPWQQWPARLKAGAIAPGDYDEAARRCHLYAQWHTHTALADLARRPDSGLYLDLPLGVHRAGYDTWRYPEVFAPAASGGAPPDPFFTAGQDWGVAPLHPEGIRRQGYSYYIACLRRHLALATMLRIDHVMGLHRLFWIPRGRDPSAGVYVRYRAAEFYALLSLESHRHRTPIVGEDLGTVPSYVRQAMARHGIRRLRVAQFELRHDRAQALSPMAAAAVSVVNTHDTFPFAGYWEGLDIADRVDRGLLDRQQAAAEQAVRRRLCAALAGYLQDRGLLAPGPLPTAALPVLRALLGHLAAGPAAVLMINLEDLWASRTPQNVPGTQAERPNWRRRAAHTLAEAAAMPAVTELLAHLDRLRRGGGAS